MIWWQGLNSKVRLNEPLKNKTTFKIGGQARFFCEPKNRTELKSLIISAKRYNMPFFVIGSGSNILVDDNGVNGLVLKLNSSSFKRITVKRNCFEAGGGLTLTKLLQAAAKEGLSGLEFLAGIPGTVGGALIMNAGSRDASIGELVQKVLVMDYNGNTKILHRKDIIFAYRSSSLENYIIINVSLALIKKSRAEIRNNISSRLEYRKRTQELTNPNAGCIFKNPTGDSAGRLIDLCGLKGKKHKGACVSSKHANFILNYRHASSGDVFKLMDIIKKMVRQRFDIELEPEIKIWQ